MSYRWTLRDLDTDELVEVPYNPNEMSGPDAPHETEVHPASPVDGRHRQWRRPRRPWEWQFSGVILDEPGLDLLQGWFERSAKIELVDHFGRSMTLRMLAFDPEPRGARKRPDGTVNTHRYKYTIRALVYDGPVPI